MQLLLNSSTADGGAGAAAAAQRMEEEQAGGILVASFSSSFSPASSPDGGGHGGVLGSPGSSNNNSNVHREKPAKAIPCPRCESMNTKFCYFNNYSMKQPRYFCRQCQRYWTVGGTLRNVPVGGGSRKKSRSSSNQRSDPYLRPPTAATLTGAGAGAGVATLISGALSGNNNNNNNNSNPLLQTLGFQQLLMQDVNLPYSMLTATGYELPPPHEQFRLKHDQNPGGLFYPVMKNSMNNNNSSSTQEVSSAMHAMYAATARGGGSASDVVVSQGVAHPMMHVNGSSYYCNPDGDFLPRDSIHQVIQWGNLVPPEQQQQQQLQITESTVWDESRHQSGGGSPAHSASDEEFNQSCNSQPRAKLQVVKAESHQPACGNNDDSRNSLLSHLSLHENSKPGFEGCCLAPNNGSSPPHGSSTIEEEGSTPINGYSTHGYEEGDAVSSMWPDLEFFH